MNDDIRHGEIAGTPRRVFLGQLAATAVGLSGAACAPANAVAGATPVPRAETSSWDDSWTKRLGARHRIVFDAPTIGSAGPSQVQETMAAYQEALHVRDSELHMVLVIRHMAIPMAFNDHLWDKYELGDQLKLKDPTTGEPARRNPFLRIATGDKFIAIDAGATLDVLHRRGVIFLGCNRAAMMQAGRLAKKSGAELSAVQEEVRANLIPGVILQPNGLYAVVRAQDAGCVLYKG